MSGIQPETIEHDLIERLNAQCSSGGRYVGRDDFEYRRMIRDSEKLIPVDPRLGYGMRAMAHMLIGDATLVKSDMSRARGYGGEADSWCDFMQTQALAKLGFFSEALPLFSACANPELGHFGSRSSVGIGVGAIRELVGMFRQADIMRLDYTSEVDREEVEDMASVLSSVDVSDVELAAMMDVAGKIARQHSVRIQEHSSRVIDLDGERLVAVCLKVDCTAREAADMVLELSDEMATMDKITPAVHVSFECV